MSQCDHKKDHSEEVEDLMNIAKKSRYLLHIEGLGTQGVTTYY